MQSVDTDRGGERRMPSRIRVFSKDLVDGYWKEVGIWRGDVVVLKVWGIAESGHEDALPYVLWRDYTYQDSRTPRRRLGQSSTTRRIDEQDPLSCFYYSM